MRGHILLVVMFSLIIGFNQVSAEFENPTDTVTSYFEACRNGDVETIKRLIAGPFYDSRKVLLLKNKSYPNFLKNYYRDVQITTTLSFTGNFDMVAKEHPRLHKRHYRKLRLYGRNYRKQDIRTDNNIIENAVVIVTHRSSDGNTFEIELLLKKDGRGNWYIYDEVLGY